MSSPRPRKVSFSDPSFSGLTALTSTTSTAPTTTAPGPSTPPPPRARFQRSPFPSHRRMESSDADVDSDVFAPSPRKHLSPTKYASPSKKYPSPKKKGSGVDVFDDAWVARSPPSSSSVSPSGSPSPSTRKTSLPHLDFSRVATPLTVRKMFTYTPIRVRQPSFGGAAAMRARSDDKENTAPAQVEEGDSIKIDVKQDIHSQRADSADSDETAADADAVELALELDDLSLSSTREHTPQSPVTTSGHPPQQARTPLFLPASPSSSVESPFDPTRSPPALDEPSFAVASEPDSDGSAEDSSLDFSPTPITKSASVHMPTAPSPSPLPPTAALAPREGPVSDSSDMSDFAPRRNAKPRRRLIVDSDDDETQAPTSNRALQKRTIVVSDDDEAAPPPKPKGLKGRVPRYIMELEAEESDCEGPAPDEPSYYEEGDSGSDLVGWIVNSDEEDEEGDEDEEAADCSILESELSSGDETDESSSSMTESESEGSYDVDWDEEEVGRAPRKPTATFVLPADIVDLVSDSDDDAVLEFVPAPPPITLPAMVDISNLTISSPPRKAKPAVEPKPNPKGSIPKRSIPKPKIALPKASPKSKGYLVTSKTPKWATHRAAYAQKLFDELDAKVFDSRLGRRGARATLEWHKRLLKTAGQAHRTPVRHKDGSRTTEYKISLSEKVLTDEHRINNTLAHEMCHLATWVISNEMNNPHGRIFKSWGHKVSSVRPDIIVTTKHSYEIACKYKWECTNPACAKVYGRHSNSINTARQVCGSCKSRLKPLFATKDATPYQLYLKAHMKSAMAVYSNFGDATRALSHRWKDAGPDADHAAYWTATARGQAAL